MNIINSISIFPLLSSIICFAVILYITLKGEKTAKLYSFLFLMSCILLWSFGQFLEYSTSEVSLILQYTKILHTGVIFLGTACLLFSLYYTGSTLLTKHSKAIFLLFIIPLVIVFFLYTNEFHWLFLKIEPIDNIQKTYIRKLGIFYWAESINNYVFVLLSIIIVIKSIIKSHGELRKQGIILLSALVIPTLSAMLFDAVGAFKKGTATSFDITPTSFSISFLLLVIITFKYSFLDIVPITLKKIFYNLKDAVIIIDRRNMVIKCNTTFTNYFGTQDNFRSMDDLLRYLSKCQIDSTIGVFQNVANSNETTSMNHEIRLRDEKSERIRVFDVSFQPVNNPTNYLIGKIITFCDITTYKELAAENERNRIALEIHDSIGYGLTNLIMLIKESKIRVGQNSVNADDMIDKTLGIAEKMLNDLRYTVSDIAYRYWICLTLRRFTNQQKTLLMI